MVKLKVKGTEQVIQLLEARASNDKLDLMLKRLADIGCDTARTSYDEQWWLRIGNGSRIKVDVKPRENGYAVVASGRQVMFVEFGAGVFYNGAESYKGTRPSNVKPIGEYGKGKGKQNTWGYYDESGDLILTHGNPPSNSMYYASEAIRKSIEEIAQEVFND